MCFWGSWSLFSGHSVPPLLFPSRSQSTLQTLLSSEADLLSSDLYLDNEKSPLEKCPMLMLRTTLAFLVGLYKTCFNTTVFLPQHGGVTTSLSAGWLKVKEDLFSSTGNSVVMTPFMWQLRGRDLGLIESCDFLQFSVRRFHKGVMFLLDRSTSLPISMVLKCLRPNLWVTVQKLQPCRKLTSNLKGKQNRRIPISVKEFSAVSKFPKLTH